MRKNIMNKLINHNISVTDYSKVHLLNTGIITEIEPFVQLRDGKYDIESIGSFTYFGGGETVMKHIKSIGRFCSIASNITTGQMEHPTDFLSSSHILHGNWSHIWGNDMKELYKNNQDNLLKSIKTHEKWIKEEKGKIEIGNDVWIGEGVFISRGVKIGDGAIIAARSVITKDVEPYTIVGGIPGKVIRKRFDDNIIEKLLNLKWWEYGFNILNNVDYTDIESAINQLEINIKNNPKKYNPTKLCIFNQDQISFK